CNDRGAMPVEIETKLRLQSHDAVRGRLIALSADPLGRLLEINHLLDRLDGSLRASDRAFRIREYRVLEAGPSPTRSVVTLNGPSLPGNDKSREEIEFDISDAQAALQMFAALGFAEKLCFQKRRETWQLDRCKVELDEIPHLGRFVEVEGPDESAV